MTGMKLIEPSTEYRDQIMRYRRDTLEKEGTVHGSCGLARFEDPDEWIRYTAACKDPETVPEGRTEATQYLFVRENDRKIVGMIQVRHRLNDYLEKYAGHIGFSVAPDERRKGYGSRMLAEALGKCRELGLDRVLVTCSTDNEGSRKTILRNGGVYESTVYEPDDREYLERYWIEIR